MKINSLKVLEANDTHIIAEVNYSLSYPFWRGKEITKKIYKDKNGFGDYWWYLDTGELFSNSNSINAMLSTNKNSYTI